MLTELCEDEEEEELEPAVELLDATDEEPRCALLRTRLRRSSGWTV